MLHVLWASNLILINDDEVNTTSLRSMTNAGYVLFICRKKYQTLDSSLYPHTFDEFPHLPTSKKYYFLFW